MASISRDSITLRLVATNTLLATWDWKDPRGTPCESTASFDVKWEYLTELSGSTWLEGSRESIDLGNVKSAADYTDTKRHLYNIPGNAIKVRFMVRPVSKPKNGSTNSKDVYWTASWSTAVEYDVKSNPPSVPPAPNPEIVFEASTGRYKIQLVLENLNVNADVINFQVLKRNATRLEAVGDYSATTIQYPPEDNGSKTNGYARYTKYVDDNGEYYARVRSVRDNLVSDWSEYAGPVYSRPLAPAEILEIRPSSKTTVYIKWSLVETAESYDIQYTTDIKNFDISDRPTSITGIKTTERDIDLSEPGKTHWFRVRAVRGDMASDWTTPVSVTAGTKPGMPTTWSSSTNAIAGEPMIFYWVHNSEDGSKEVEATLELTIGVDVIPIVIPNERSDDDTSNISFYSYDTTGLVGAEILWRVKTKGVHDDYGDWSVQRTVKVYSPPYLTLGVSDSNDDNIDRFTAFPMHITATPGPVVQRPISYYITIVADESHETVDNFGNFKMVAKGDVIFTRYYDIPDPLDVILSAGDVTFENNVRYVLRCEVTMDSGLTAEATTTFTTAWADEVYMLNAEVGIDMDSYTATILPYCRDNAGRLVGNTKLSVYRRDYDGKFTEIAIEIPNDGTTVTDPHPALDYARYRIVATNTVSGNVTYYDMPGVEVGEHAILIQWSEPRSNYDSPYSNAQTEASWSGSFLRLPYNIDVQENINPDVTRVEYIGRQHPVSYFGTHLGESANWATVIDKDDDETLFGLRRLARWMGNVYVREPSGVGYWATIKVSIGRNHGDVTIPVSLSINRVEGGM